MEKGKNSMNADPVKIYLGDLGHYTTVLANNVVPLNIDAENGLLEEDFG